ncbi:MAG: YraN family protein [Rikenellaceae bacterium]
MIPRRATIGEVGERAAVAYLRSNGFMIRERNWRNGRYEIDIIAERWGVIHFVEVKSRKVDGWSTPEQAIDKHKFESLRRAAAAYLGINAIRGEHQFDLVAVDMQGEEPVAVRFTENAMQSAW